MVMIVMVFVHRVRTNKANKDTGSEVKFGANVNGRG